MLGRFFYLLGELELAEGLFLQAATGGQVELAMSDLCLLYFEQGGAEDALRACQESAVPIEYWMLRGENAKQAGNLDAAQRAFQLAAGLVLNLLGDYFTPPGVEFYGQLNCLKAGIVYADVITTVSPRYAREITTEEMGCSLDGLLRQRNSKLVGLLNGVDYDLWNPISDT